MENKANGISVQLGKGENRITVHGTWLRCLKVAYFGLYIVLSVSDLLLNLKQLNQNKYLSFLTSTVCLF